MNAIRTVLLTLSLGLALPAQATPSTPTGAISVAQVVDLIRRSPTDNAARNAAMAYLAGVGEATGLLVAEAGRRSSVTITCARPLGISSTTALAALSRTDKGTWDRTAATPIVVDDMLSRAGCR
ncbi:chlorophyllide reductase [Kaistia dalseonensis]|uniref:Chlorophyllide reductase n=1 Tax=Kaistia dalseonensis TaxID=410840 RepID=A0ABU0H2G3_9HYPH|nr:chlorophyllide reductase [Kaistia dalseonensis]MCX5493679.1 chlorophyllide reductase [Kaistia dalseonensis]MDQ0436242.1 hypothetical protein [Kaistia dalseonensis]